MWGVAMCGGGLMWGGVDVGDPYPDEVPRARSLISPRN